MLVPGPPLLPLLTAQKKSKSPLLIIARKNSKYVNWHFYTLHPIFAGGGILSKTDPQSLPWNSGGGVIRGPPPTESAGGSHVPL